MKTSSIEYAIRKYRPRKPSKKSYKAALYLAATYAYESEVLQPLMVPLIIGPDKEYVSKDEWIEDRVQEWLKEVERN